MSVALRIPILNNFQQNGASGETLEQKFRLLYHTEASGQRLLRRSSMYIPKIFHVKWSTNALLNDQEARIGKAVSRSSLIGVFFLSLSD